jgi:hypothetical protein
VRFLPSAATALVLALPPPAQAAAGPRAAPALTAASVPAAPSRVRTDRGTLVLSVAEGRGRTRSVSLECSAEPEGTHPSPGTACAQLSAAHGDFGALPRAEARCRGRGGGPVTAIAAGTWQGGEVNWRGEYAGHCALAARTGAVFGF